MSDLEKIDKYFSFFLSFILGCITVIGVTLIILSQQELNHNDKTIVSHNCAQYNAKTGDFEWLDTITKPQETRK